MGFFDDFNLGDVVSAFIPSAITTAGALAVQPQENYGTSQAYLDAKLAQDQAQFMATLEFQKQQAANAGGGGGSGAAMAAAKLNAAVQMAALRERALATRLSAQMQASRGIPEIIQGAQKNVLDTTLARGQAAQQGFTDMGRMLAGYRQ